jgi:transcriptional regulator with XRE-family HTH domain
MLRVFFEHPQPVVEGELAVDILGASGLACRAGAILLDAIAGLEAYLPLRTESKPILKMGRELRSADLIREARLRAGLSQHELAELTGRDRTVSARWEHGHVAPSLETLLELLHACGFDLPVELVPYDPPGGRLHKNALLSPERRAQRLLRERGKASGREP